jgi:acyl-CoA synthetase (AMP-forming)/AMP-acid ligase II
VEPAKAVPPVPTPLRVVAVSGSALPGGLATRFMDAYGDVLYNLYGSTEASWVSIATPEELRHAPNTAGRPPHGTRVSIVSQAGAPMPPGHTGRILVGNEMLFEGYTNGTSGARQDGLLATGDLGHVDQDGLLYVDGREDDMIVSGGENVFPSEVEDLLAGLPQVREVAVVGVPDAEFGQRLVAWIALYPGEVLDADAVREYVRRNLARFAVPRDVRFVRALPRNATGKVVPRDLPGR